jgi:putative ABC transport system substrate-binding protein
VFVESGDPVAAGFVATLMRPGGNVTGFARPDMPVTGDWLDVLRQAAANVRRAAVLRDFAAPSGRSQLAAIQATAQALDISVSSIDVRDAAAMERAVGEFARLPGGVLVVESSAAALQHRDLIISLAARHKLPAIYNERRYPAAGGLLSIGPDLNDEYRRAADYVDRILKGEKPAEMPVRASVKIQFVINNKTAKALNLAMPKALLARADEVIE